MTTGNNKNFIWHVRWAGTELVGPNGQKYPIIPGDCLDIQLGHRLIDNWEKEFGLLDDIPRIGNYSLWWIIRFGLLHSCLVNLLTQMRLLCKIRGSIEKIPSHIIIEGPAESWSVNLFKTVFPESTVSVSSRKTVDKEKIIRGAIRLYRGWDGYRRLRKLSAPDPKKPRVLVVSRDRTWTGQRDSELGTVIEALESSGMEIIVLVQTAAGRPKDNLRAHRTRPGNHLWEDMVYARHLLKKGRPGLPDFKLPSSGFTFQDFDLSGIVNQIATPFLTRRFQQYSILSETLPEIIANIGISAAILTDENCGSNGIKLGLKQAQIPTIGIQHGVIHSHHLAYMFPKDTDPNTVSLCDYTCVYGEFERELLVNNSIYPESSVVVTGQTQMDHRDLANRKLLERGEKGNALRERYMPAGCDRMLLFTSQEDVYRIETAPLLLEAIAKSSKRNFLVIRPHPGEVPEPFWSEQISRFGLNDRVLVQKEGDLEGWLDACDIHLSATSTVLSEAVVFARPNITIGSRRFGDPMSTIAESVAVELEDFRCLDAAVNYWLDTESNLQLFEDNRQKYIKRHFYKIDGQSGKRIAELVKKVICESKGHS